MQKNRDKEKFELVFYFFLLKYLGPTFTTSHKYIWLINLNTSFKTIFLLLPSPPPRLKKPPQWTLTWEFSWRVRYPPGYRLCRVCPQATKNPSCSLRSVAVGPPTHWWHIRDMCKIELGGFILRGRTKLTQHPYFGRLKNYIFENLMKKKCK